MGVDFFACDKCGSTFPDCGEWQSCPAGHYLCPNCMSNEAEGDGDYPVTVEECPVCLAGGNELEQALAKIAKLEKKLHDQEEDMAWLNCLRSAGVDNWEGFDYACEKMDAWRKKNGREEE